jgi:hypothetical protein
MYPSTYSWPRLHASATLPPGKKAPGTHSIGSWVGLRAGLDDVEKGTFFNLPGLELRPLGDPARSLTDLHMFYRKLLNCRFEKCVLHLWLAVFFWGGGGVLGMGWDWVHLVRRPLNGLLYPPRMIGEDECGAVGGSTQRKPAPVPLCPPQMPHYLTRARTQTAAVGSRRLTAWALTWPTFIIAGSDNGDVFRDRK